MRSKKIPLRKCIVTGERLPKNDLLRIAYTKDGELSIDPTGKAPGRGFYIKKNEQVCKQAKAKNVIFQQLKIPEQTDFYEQLIEYVSKLEGNDNE